METLIILLKKKVKKVLSVQNAFSDSATTAKKKTVHSNWYITINYMITDTYTAFSGVAGWGEAEM